nr:hypothetical protein BOH68_11025 [Cobetia sp. MM1IDA2H-1]
MIQVVTRTLLRPASRLRAVTVISTLTIRFDQITGRIKREVLFPQRRNSLAQTTQGIIAIAPNIIAVSILSKAM